MLLLLLLLFHNFTHNMINEEKAPRWSRSRILHSHCCGPGAIPGQGAHLATEELTLCRS